MVPVDLATNPDELFHSAAADEWFNGPDDLSDYGLGEDCHGYSVESY